jgi:hypothetical protein
MGRFAELKLEHLIPRERLEMPYLTRIAQSIGYSQAILERVSTPPEYAGKTNIIRRFVNQLAQHYYQFRQEPHRRAVQLAFQRGKAEGQIIELDKLVGVAAS